MKGRRDLCGLGMRASEVRTNKNRCKNMDNGLRGRDARKRWKDGIKDRNRWNTVGRNQIYGLGEAGI